MNNQPNSDFSPHIDYLSKDFASFRRLMFEQLALLQPDWQETSPADLGYVLVDLLAYAADYASYFQDAVATEAYLGTARLRRSVRRHARLLDYNLHEGCNARVWIVVELRQGTDQNRTGLLLPEGTQLFTWMDGVDPVIELHSPASSDSILGEKTTVFETMHAARLYPAHNKLSFYHQPGSSAALPAGSTSACLEIPQVEDDPAVTMLQPGDVLLMEELHQPDNPRLPPDPSHRHVVRLVSCRQVRRAGRTLMHIAWHSEDALPFPLTIRRARGPEVGVARGNVVLADHGRTLNSHRAVLGERLPDIPESGRYRPWLRVAGLTHRVPYRHEQARSLSAAATLQQDPREALPSITLLERGPQLRIESLKAMLAPLEAVETVGDDQFTSVFTYRWLPRRSLLNSRRLDRDFVVEVEGDGRAYLRFGYAGLGRDPSPGTEFFARYRVGGGLEGNVGTGTISHIALPSPLAANVTAVHNPLPAQGGLRREELETARLHAPNSHRIQERAVTAADYEMIARRHPDVVQAIADLLQVGSWTTAVVYIQPRHQLGLDTAFKAQMRAFFKPYQMMGYELSLRGPQYVPLSIRLKVTLLPNHHARTVERALRRALGSQRFGQGDTGFFHPVRLTFGQPVYLSQVIARAMAVPGVQEVFVSEFRRLEEPEGMIATPAIAIQRREIALLDTDSQQPLHGDLVIEMEGGLQ
ncbi:MAG: putative baseplate assembly protein [Anaerolineales bacterium]|jgi:hypothetical protein